MGLLISDTLLIDPLLDEAMRLLDGFTAWAYAPDDGRDSDDHEGADRPA